MLQAQMITDTQISGDHSNVFHRIQITIIQTLSWKPSNPRIQHRQHQLKHQPLEKVKRFLTAPILPSISRASCLLRKSISIAATSALNATTPTVFARCIFADLETSTQRHSQRELTPTG